jgi:hypothetical protein
VGSRRLELDRDGSFLKRRRRKRSLWNRGKIVFLFFTKQGVGSIREIEVKRER